MESPLNIYGQTKEWENACIHTRRDIAKREKRLQIFSIKKTNKVLDLGCGDGLNVGILHKLGIKDVVGVDISTELLKEARKNNPKAKFILGSAEKLPFKAQTFDIVFVDSVFHHLLEYNKTIIEIRRVLKPHGLLCFIEPHRSFFRWLLDFISILPISSFFPVIKERRIAYLGEKRFMTHWLATEDEFYKKLEKGKFKKNFLRQDFLSVVGEYRKD